MFTSYLSLLAPVVILLLSAFVLSIVMPRLPDSWQAHWMARYGLAPGWVILAGLVLLPAWLTGPEETFLLSGWNFFTTESGIGLEIGPNQTRRPFLLLTFLILLVAMLRSLPMTMPKGRSWLLCLGGSAGLLFLSANVLTLAYTLLLFDVVLASYWLAHNQSHLATARLFLSILTVGLLALQGYFVEFGNISSYALLAGSLLWLRLGLYPFFEIDAAENHPQDHSLLTYWALSLAVGLYLAVQLQAAFPAIIQWIIILTIILNGLRAWLVEKPTQHHTPRLAVTLALLPLLVAVPSPTMISVYTLGLMLSLAACWVTLPNRLNPSKVLDGWPYLPAAAGVITFIGLPFSLTWPVWSTFYSAGISSTLAATLLVFVAVTLALSGLVRYGLTVWRAESRVEPSSHLPASIAAIVAALPFLIPGIGPILFSALLSTPLPAVSLNKSASALVMIAISTAAAIGLGYFRGQIIIQTRISPAAVLPLLHLDWLVKGIENSLSRIGKLILRANVIFEGQHYMGWALFTALVGSLIILLTRGF